MGKVFLAEFKVVLLGVLIVHLKGYGFQLNTVLGYDNLPFHLHAVTVKEVQATIAHFSGVVRGAYGDYAVKGAGCTFLNGEPFAVLVRDNTPVLVGFDMEGNVGAVLGHIQFPFGHIHIQERYALLVHNNPLAYPFAAGDEDGVRAVVQFGVVVVLDLHGGVLSLADADQGIGNGLTLFRLYHAPGGMQAAEGPGLGGLHHYGKGRGVCSRKVIHVLDPVAEIHHVVQGDGGFLGGAGRYGQRHCHET